MRALHHSFLAVALLTAACSRGALAPGADAATPDAAAGLSDFTDGTRLKALAYVTVDEQKLWHGWRDTARGEICSFAQTSDGELRCLPDFVTTSASAFSDAACTKPVVALAACTGPAAAPAAYVSAGRDKSCGNVSALYKRMARVSAGTPMFTLIDGTCIPTSFGPAFEFYAVADTPEPNDAFVRADEVQEELGPALSARFYHADDGALQLAGAFDRAANRPCAESPRAPGICAPDPLISVALMGEFADDACTISTVVAAGWCSEVGHPPDLVFSPPSENKPTGQFYRLGDPFNGIPYLLRNGVCGPPTDILGFNLPANPYRYALGEEVAASTLPAVHTADLGKNRLKVRMVVAPDGRHLSGKRIFDSVEGVTCTPWSADGALHCLPDAYVSFDAYEDAACERPVLVDDQSSTVTKFVVDSSAPLCGTPAAPPRYFEVGAAAREIQIYSTLPMGACMPQGMRYARQLIEHPLSDAPALGGE